MRQNSKGAKGAREEWRPEEKRTALWEWNSGSVGGKAKQVYAEKRRKLEMWERKERYRNKGGSSESKRRLETQQGLVSLGQTHRPVGGEGAQKCIGQEINIPTLNEQLLHGWGMSIYEGLQVSDPEVICFVILPLTPSICPPGLRLLSDQGGGFQKMNSSKAEKRISIKNNGVYTPGAFLNIETPYCSQGLI